MIYQLIGLALFLTGCAHLLKWTDTTDFNIVQTLQEYINKKIPIKIFKEIWFLGRTTFAVIILFLIISFNIKLGFTAAAVFLVIVGIEQLVKQAVNRKRPFEVHQSILMLQPQEPIDASFPSGDTLRIWFLAMILPIAAGNSTYMLLAMITIALFVSLGRIAMGVHYLTDILAGAGLGILGAGTTIWLWHIFNLL